MWLEPSTTEIFFVMLVEPVVEFTALRLLCFVTEAVVASLFFPLTFFVVSNLFADLIIFFLLTSGLFQALCRG
jgi:hypothetical protein